MDTAAVEKSLGALGTAFRLSRLYPPGHPAVTEAVRQLQQTLRGLAAQGSIEWRVGSTGFAVGSQVLLPRNSQLGELASLLYSRGVRRIALTPGATADNFLAACRVATGALALDDPALGRVALELGRRSVRVSAMRAAPLPPLPPPPPAAPGARLPPGAAAGAGPTPLARPPALADRGPLAPRATGVFLSGALPSEIAASRVLAALRDATEPAAQLEAVRQLPDLAQEIRALRDVSILAEAIAALDRLMSRATDERLLEAIGKAAEALADRNALGRLVARLGEQRVPPAERGALVRAVGAMAAVCTPQVLDAFLNAPTALREPYRAAIRHAADRAAEPLTQRIAGGANDTTLAAVAELLGLTGSPSAVVPLQGLLKHPSPDVREAALLALAEIGGREVARLALPLVRDDSALVRRAAVRAAGASGDPGAAAMLAGRLETEADEGVIVELLRMLGALGDRAAVEVIAQFADPGSMFSRRHPVDIRVEAVEALGAIRSPEARAALERHRTDKEPAVRAAVEAALA